MHYALQGLGAPTIHPAVLRRFKSYGRTTPAALFSNGEQGAWFDPSDFSTMFQDSAGTTPVTAVEQPVGRINDKSGRGNNATQGTAAARPILRARYNLLTYSEQFDNGAWSKTGLTVDGTKVLAPDGETTAQTLVWASGTSPQITQNQTIVAGTPLIHSISAKAGTKSSVMLLLYADGSNYALCSFNLLTGAAGSVTVVGTRFTSVAATISAQANGFYRCSLSANTNTFTTVAYWVRGDTMTGSGDTIVVWGADLRATNDGISLPVYQRIAAATDYDTAGFPPYLAFDGTDDSLATGAIDFSATDEMTVVAGVRKLSDAAQGAIVELTASTASNNGSFLLAAPDAASATFGWDSKGTTQIDAVASSQTAPITGVVTGMADISGDTMAIRVNGAQSDSDTGDQGTGSYSNAALYIGSRNSASLRFNGRLYGLVVRGKTTDATQLAQVENWMNTKTRAY